MMTGNGRSAGGTLRQIPSRVILAGLGLVGVLTVVAAALSWWPGAIIGVVILHLGTALAVVGPWGSRPVKVPKVSDAKLTAQLDDLERRVDALGSRLIATTERTRVELLDALAARTGGSEDRPS